MQGSDLCGPPHRRHGTGETSPSRQEFNRVALTAKGVAVRQFHRRGASQGSISMRAGDLTPREIDS